MGRRHMALDQDSWSAVDLEVVLKALASERRLQILEWLKDPVANFPPQELATPTITVLAICSLLSGSASANRLVLAI